MCFPGAGQKKVVIVQPISNGRFTIIPQEQQTDSKYQYFIYKQHLSMYFPILRMANKRVHQSVLEDLGGGPGPPPPVANCPAQR